MIPMIEEKNTITIDSYMGETHLKFYKDLLRRGIDILDIKCPFLISGNPLTTDTKIIYYSSVNELLTSLLINSMVSPENCIYNYFKCLRAEEELNFLKEDLNLLFLEDLRVFGEKLVNTELIEADNFIKKNSDIIGKCKEILNRIFPKTLKEVNVTFGYNEIFFSKIILVNYSKKCAISHFDDWSIGLFPVKYSNRKSDYPSEERLEYLKKSMEELSSLSFSENFYLVLFKDNQYEFSDVLCESVFRIMEGI